jgi:hypothetical protein
VVFGETLSDPVCTVEVFASVDTVPEEMLEGGATVSGTVVTQQIKLGNGGVIYSIICTLEGASGRTYKSIQRLAVLSDIGAGFGLGRGLAIVGELPDTYAYIDYYELLDIIDGYEPFGPVTVYSGNYPIGWTPTISNHNIVTSGIANDTGTFTFVYKLVDFAGQVAYSAQEVYIPPVDLYGSIPAIGYVGIPYTGHYDARWGMPPYAFDTSVGTVPPGLALSQTDADTCTYAGTPTTSGVYPITTRVTDDIDEYDTEPATITIWAPVFLAVGNHSRIFASFDGINWDTYTTPGDLSLRRILYVDGNFYVAAWSDIVMVSPDLVNWTTYNIGWPAPQFNAFAYGEGRFVASADDGGGTTTYIYTSDDNCQTWTARTVPASASQSPNDATYGNGVFVIACTSGGVSAGVLMSPDGTTWTGGLLNTSFFGVTYDDGQFMMVGESAVTYTSPDGTTWTYHSAGGGVSYSFEACAFAHSAWFATANGGSTYNGVYKTTDNGDNWTRVVTGFGNPLAIAAINGTVIAIASPGGGDDTEMTTDGVNWTSGEIGFGNTANALYTAYIPPGVL